MRLRITLLLAALVAVPLFPNPAGATWTTSCLGHPADVIGTDADEFFTPGLSDDHNEDG